MAAPRDDPVFNSSCSKASYFDSPLPRLSRDPISDFLSIRRCRCPLYRETLYRIIVGSMSSTFLDLHRHKTLNQKIRLDRPHIDEMSANGEMVDSKLEGTPQRLCPHSPVLSKNDGSPTTKSIANDAAAPCATI